MPNLRIAGLAGALVISALVGGTLISAVAASTAPATSDRVAAAAPSAVAARDPGEYCANFRAAFAANLGVSEAAMTAAARKAAISTVDKAVADGDMTKAAGDRLKARIDAAPADGCALLAGLRAKAAKALGVIKDGMVAAADALKMTPADLRADLRGGKSLKDVAAAHNVPYATLSDAIMAAVKADLDAAVKAGTIKQARADRILERLEQRLAAGQLRPARPAASPTAGG